MSKSILIGVASAGAIGGVATGSYYLLKSETPKEESTKITTPKTLLQELAGDDFEALNINADEKDNDVWGKLIPKHISESATPKITFTTQITKHDTSNSAQNIKAFKNACKSLFEKTTISESDKSLAKNWCNKKSKLLDAGG